MTKRTVITIDGLAGSGKSTIADGLALRLGFRVLHSGLLYRAAAALLPKTFDEDTATNIIQTCELKTEGDLHSDEIAQKASKIASFPAVRALLIDRQRTFAGDASLIAEGRDMGTVIFPDALCKFFIVVPAEVRAKRRVSQYGGDYQTVLADIKERDKRDSERKIAPTVPAADAKIIENGEGVTLTEVLDHMYHLAVSLGAEKST